MGKNITLHLQEIVFSSSDTETSRAIVQPKPELAWSIGVFTLYSRLLHTKATLRYLPVKKVCTKCDLCEEMPLSCPHFNLSSTSTRQVSPTSPLS